MARHSFVDVVQGRAKKLEFYTSEGEEDFTDDLGILEIIQDQDIIVEGELCPVVDIPWEIYQKSWRQALIIKILEKSLSFRVMTVGARV